MNWTPPPPPPHPPPSIHAARTEAHLADVSRLHTGPIMVPRRTPNTAPSQHSHCGRLAARRMRSGFTPHRRFTSSFLNGPEHIQNRLLLEGVCFIINPKTREGTFNYRVSDQKPFCVCVCVQLRAQRSKVMEMKMMKMKMVMVLTARGRVVVEVQSFHDQRVRPLHTERNSSVEKIHNSSLHILSRESKDFRLNNQN